MSYGCVNQCLSVFYRRSDRKYFNLRPFAAVLPRDSKEKESFRPPHVILKNTINLERQNRSTETIIASFSSKQAVLEAILISISEKQATGLRTKKDSFIVVCNYFLISLYLCNSNKTNHVSHFTFIFRINLLRCSSLWRRLAKLRDIQTSLTI